MKVCILYPVVSVHYLNNLFFRWLEQTFSLIESKCSMIVKLN